MITNKLLITLGLVTSIFVTTQKIFNILDYNENKTILYDTLDSNLARATKLSEEEINKIMQKYLQEMTNQQE